MGVGFALGRQLFGARRRGLNARTRDRAGSGSWGRADACGSGTGPDCPIIRGSIEEVVRRTWRDREESPAAALRSCSRLLAELKVPLSLVPLEESIYPHAILGPLDARQRLEFLAFHIRRHREQVVAVMSHPAFPKSPT
jgi:hypothetical protein